MRLIKSTCQTRGFSLPPTQSPTLTEAELRLMEVLWEKGTGTVQQLLDALPKKKPLAYNSVLTTVRILERKGYVKHVKDGRAHIYLPLLGRKEAARFEVRNLVRRLFKNSHELLVLNVLEDQSLSKDDLRRLRDLVKDKGYA